jgi:integrase
MIENESVRDTITFMVFTGLRVSEACGLRFCDINFRDRVLTVNKQIYHTTSNEKGYILIPPKCNNISSILLNDIALSILIKQKDISFHKLEDFVFVNYNNEPFRIDGILKFQLEKAVEKLKNMGQLDRDKNITFHSFRHSYASMLVHLNENIHTVQHLLRHKDFKVTYNTYAHFYSNCNPKSFESINNEFKSLNTIETQDK